MEKMLQAMWPLVALKFRQQLGRDVVKGKAGRQLPTRHVPASASASAAWASLDPQLEPDLREVAALGQWSSESAGKWSWVRGVMGFNSCIPFLLCLPVATATQEQEHHFHGMLLGKGEEGCASGRGVGRQDGALPIPSVSIENCFTSIPTTNPVWAPLTILPPPHRDAGPGWAMPGCDHPFICPCWNEGSHHWTHPSDRSWS